MTPLPPVRKRTNYADLSSGDLTFALFWDKALGEIGAMREDREVLRPRQEKPRMRKKTRARKSKR